MQFLPFCSVIVSVCPSTDDDAVRQLMSFMFTFLSLLLIFPTEQILLLSAGFPSSFPSQFWFHFIFLQFNIFTRSIKGHKRNIKHCNIWWNAVQFNVWEVIVVLVDYIVNYICYWCHFHQYSTQAIKEYRKFTRNQKYGFQFANKFTEIHISFDYWDVFFSFFLVKILFLWFHNTPLFAVIYI